LENSIPLGQKLTVATRKRKKPENQNSTVLDLNSLDLPSSLAYYPSLQLLLEEDTGNQ
jgi:hypothetical protein